MKTNMTRLVVAASALFFLLSGQPASEARSNGFASIEDASLQNNKDYQRWKKLVASTRSCRDLWSRWTEAGLTVHIAMGSIGAEITGGAALTDIRFDDADRLKEATIKLESGFAERAPLNAAPYPILSSLSDVSRNVRAMAFLAHEFGHVEYARIIGGRIYQGQNKLLRASRAGYIKYGWDWFHRAEYRGIVDELGAAPFDVVREREIRAEETTIAILRDYFAADMPATVRKAIQSYEPLR